MSERQRKLIKLVRGLDGSSLGKFDSGPLTDDEIAVGMHLSFKNAEDLQDDALLLYKNERFGRALSLLILALEELGRIPILLNTVLIKKDDQATWKKVWDALRRHHLKQGVWTAYGKKLVEENHPDARYFVPIPLDQIPLLDKFKQCGFYVTCLDGNFLSPNSFARFDKVKIENLFGLVRDRIQGFKGLHSRARDSYRAVLHLRTEIKAWSEEQLKKEVEEIFAEVTRSPKAVPSKTVH
jgi:AbiV family abortive infection protein